MAKIKYDIRGTERGGGEFDTTIEPGLYQAKLKSAELAQSKPSEKNPKGLQMLKLVFQLESSKWKGALISTNVFPGYDAAAWKWAEFLDAVWLVKGKKEAGSFDTDKVVGAPVQLRIKAGSYDGEYKPEIGKVLPPKPGDDEDDDEDEDDDDEADVEDLEEDDEGEEEADDEDEDEDEDEDDDDGDEDGDDALPSEADINDMNIKELKALAAEHGVKVKAGSKSPTYRTALIEELHGGEEDDDEDDDDEEDYSDWSLEDLQKEVKHRRLKVSGKGSKKALIKALESDDEDDDIFGDD